MLWYIILYQRHYLGNDKLIQISYSDTLLSLAFCIHRYRKATFEFSLRALLIRGRPFDSEGGGGWHFLEINVLTLKILEINYLSYSGKKINHLT